MLRVAGGVVEALVGFAVIGYVVVTAWWAFRAVTHRVPPAVGDPDLAAALAALADRQTKKLAVAALDLGVAPDPRYASIGADEGTRFEIGSVTKALTGILLAQAIDRGEVALSTTVGSVLPETTESACGSATLRELCTHTSGLPRLPHGPSTVARMLAFGLLGLDPYRGVGPQWMVRMAARARLRHRGHPAYSNLGAAVLGQVLAVAAGTDYPALLRERILDPVGMTGTSVAGRADTAPRGRSGAGAPR